MPRDVLVGIILSGVGVGFTGITFGWGYFAQRPLIGAGDFVAFFQTQNLLLAAQNLILYLGFFLLLNGTLRVLPKVGVWSWLGLVLILAGGVALAIGDIAGFFLAPLIYPPAFNSPNFQSDWALYSEIRAVAGFAGSIAVVLGTLLSLIGVARGVLARRAAPEPPAAT